MDKCIVGNVGTQFGKEAHCYNTVGLTVDTVESEMLPLFHTFLFFNPSTYMSHNATQICQITGNFLWSQTGFYTSIFRNALPKTLKLSILCPVYINICNATPLFIVTFTNKSLTNFSAF